MADNNTGGKTPTTAPAHFHGSNPTVNLGGGPPSTAAIRREWRKTHTAKRWSEIENAWVLDAVTALYTPNVSEVCLYATIRDGYAERFSQQRTPSAWTCQLGAMARLPQYKQFSTALSAAARGARGGTTPPEVEGPRSRWLSQERETLLRCASGSFTCTDTRKALVHFIKANPTRTINAVRARLCRFKYALEQANGAPIRKDGSSVYGNFHRNLSTLMRSLDILRAAADPEAPSLTAVEAGPAFPFPHPGAFFPAWLVSDAAPPNVRVAQQGKIVSTATHTQAHAPREYLDAIGAPPATVPVAKVSSTGLVEALKPVLPTLGYPVPLSATDDPVGRLLGVRGLVPDGVLLDALAKAVRS